MRVERFDVECDVRSVPTARRAAAGALASSVTDAEVLDAAELVVGELVANAVLHGAAPVRLSVGPGATGDAVRVEVSDGSRTLPVRPRARLEGLTGRGLGLIDAVAAAWGVDAAAHGKTVWVDLTPGSVRAARPSDLSVEDVLAGFDDVTEDHGEPRYTVTLGDVPTDLLLQAKAHIESVVRELTLSSAGARAGMTASISPQLADLVRDIEQFADARRAITGQAIAAAERGDPRTRLTLTLPASAADAGLRYLAALEQADAFAREARLLTLAPPAQHTAFRRWYVHALVDGLRRAAAGLPAMAAPSFETHLLHEIDHLAALQQVSERSARLQRVTADLSAARGRAQVAEIVLREAVAELTAARGVLLVPHDDAAEAVADVGWSAPALRRVLEDWRRRSHGPAVTAWETSAPVWLESRSESDAAYPDGSASGASCAVPLPVAGHLSGVLLLEFSDTRLFAEDERAFLLALTAVGAQAFDRADLYDGQAELADRLTRLQSVASALAVAEDEQAVLDVVIAHATGLVGARTASLCLLGPDGRTVTMARMRPERGPEHEPWETFGIDDPVPASEALRTAEIVYAADLAERDRRWPSMAGFAHDYEHSFIGMPLRGDGRVLGVVTLSFPAERGREPELSFLQAFADACGQALVRARAGERARAANARLAFLARASQELSESLDVERTLARIARLAVPELADWCVVHLLQDGELRALAAEHVDPGRTALAREAQQRWPERMSDPDGIAQVVRSGEPVLVADIDATIAAMEAAGVPQPERDPEHQAVLDSLGLSSCVLTPLSARGRTLGALTFITAESGRRYDEDDLQFCLDLARRAAVALDNARLFTAVAERAVVSGMPAEGGEAAAGRRTVEQTARLLETMTDAFFRLDRDWRFSYVNGQAERVLRRGREELLGNVVWDEFPEAVDGPFQESYETAAATGQQVTFEAWFAPLDTWFEVRATPDPDGLSVFFHDVTTRKTAERGREHAAMRLAMLAEATRELVGALDPGAVLQRLSDVLVPRMGDWAVAVLVDDERRTVAARSSHAEPESAALLAAGVARHSEALTALPSVATVLATGRPLAVPAPDLSGVVDGDLGVPASSGRPGPGSALVVPLQSGRATLGVIVVVNGPERPPFEPDDLHTAADIGARAGLAVQNALLFERQRRAVEVLQRSMLTALPDPASLELAARYRAAAEEAQVGGDWYDAFQQPDGATVLVIGDVMGHDVGAAAAMGQLRSLLRGTAYDRQESPARVLGRVDAALRGLRIDTLATALVARVEQAADQRERGTRTLRWSNAGHPPAVLRRVDGEVLTLAAEDGMLLGLDPSGDRHDHTVELCSGDTLLLYTDGLVERRDSPIAEGIERLCGALRELGGLPLDELCDALLARLLPEAPDDDVAVVAVRPRPVPPVPRPATGQVAPARRP